MACSRMRGLRSKTASWARASVAGLPSMRVSWSTRTSRVASFSAMSICIRAGTASGFCHLLNFALSADSVVESLEGSAAAEARAVRRAREPVSR